MLENLVEPLSPEAVAPPVEPTTPEPAAPVKGGLSDELLQVPAMQAITAGQPAAFSASLEEFKKRPEAKLFIDNKDKLLKAGFGLYRSLDGAQGVIFNQMHLHGDELKQADTEGRLQEVAPPFDTVNDAVGSSGGNNPVLSAQGPSALRSAPVPNLPSAAGIPTAGAGVQKKNAAARTANALPGAPTSGPQPGAGRLLNSILKPVI